MTGQDLTEQVAYEQRGETGKDSVWIYEENIAGAGNKSRALHAHIAEDGTEWGKRKREAQDGLEQRCGSLTCISFLSVNSSFIYISSGLQFPLPTPRSLSSHYFPSTPGSKPPSPEKNRPSRVFNQVHQVTVRPGPYSYTKPGWGNSVRRTGSQRQAKESNHPLLPQSGIP